MIATPPSSFPQSTGPAWQPDRLRPFDKSRTRGCFLRRTAICIATFLLACFTGHGEVHPPTSNKASATLTFRVYNYAGVDAEELQAASEQAAMIFRNIGIETVWKLCRTNTQTEGEGPCPVTSNPTILAMRILAVPLPIEGMEGHMIFGFALPPGRNGFGNIASVFWSRVKELADSKKLSSGTVLGAILAHEAGHLLLGEDSHFPVGLMKAVWTDAEMMRIGQRSLMFWNGQRKDIERAVMQRVHAAQPRVELASFASW